MTETDKSSHWHFAVPLVGVVVMVAGVLCAIGLADAATESDGLAAFDPGLTREAVSRRTPVLTAFARTFTFIGSTAVLVTLTVVAVLLLWLWTRTLRTPGLLLLAMIGSAALTVGLKTLIERQRPDATFRLGPVASSFAFPSGHSLNSAVFFLALATIVLLRLKSLWMKILLAVIAVALTIGVGLSRVYLGYHWATDVLGGWTIALAWLAIVVNIAYLTRRRQDTAVAQPGE